MKGENPDLSYITRHNSERSAFPLYDVDFIYSKKKKGFSFQPNCNGNPPYGAHHVPPAIDRSWLVETEKQAANEKLTRKRLSASQL